MKYLFLPFVVLLLEGLGLATEAIQWVNKPALTFEEHSNNWHVAFELSSPSDVEVAIIDPEKSIVVRHLAAGVLGAKVPPPLTPNALAQKIEWNGKDDYGNPVRNAAGMAVRVRVGMSVSLEQIVGGDPYAYYSEEMGANDHSPWSISGLEAKSDGKVYVWGHSSNLGPPALR